MEELSTTRSTSDSGTSAPLALSAYSTFALALVLVHNYSSIPIPLLLFSLPKQAKVSSLPIGSATATNVPVPPTISMLDVYLPGLPTARRKTEMEKRVRLAPPHDGLVTWTRRNLRSMTQPPPRHSKGNNAAAPATVRDPGCSARPFRQPGFVLSPVTNMLGGRR